MAPDLIYFVLFSPSSNLGHRFWGFLLFNLPMCFLLNYLIYKYIQELFICTLPNFISKKYMYIIKNKSIGCTNPIFYFCFIIFNYKSIILVR
ncbi:DUF4184 family protein [Terrisporobacter petrolearius]|uniref:DUF4184 family protein n=1 Tax=Terrisporobacter petrolearius TaxID=1460447 RepID=UPI003AFFDA14